ncbi:MAG: hypothetical protein P8R42_28560 [Candidatus Binatia bacterium]|nr:hypothetical protein [Candidatus Binatia bacterium]
MDLMTYEPVGDKKNSDFFNEYRLKIYERRQASGVQDLLGAMRAIVIQVETGDSLGYLEEVYHTTPYRLESVRLGETHKVHMLRARPTSPILMVLEPLSAQFIDPITRLNRLYPLARDKRNARYVGEVFHTKDLGATRDTLESHNIRFEYAGEVENPFYAAGRFLWTFPSDSTTNRVGYTDSNLDDLAELPLGETIQITAEEQARLDAADAFAEENGLKSLILGVDHMASRILAGEREDAILEFLTMSPYYLWGAYNIAEQNSSTNVSRNPNVEDDKDSPAKVFTANNTPSFVNSFENLPMPTEDFVRNFGRRMHHIAQEVKDGDHASGVKNLDFVVDTLRDSGVPFLAQVVGECTDKPNLKQIFSKHSAYSLLITEYVERCLGYEGFFTKDNVAALTQAAGQDEHYKHGNVFD